jgi:hypothetical protein
MQADWFFYAFGIDRRGCPVDRPTSRTFGKNKAMIRHPLRVVYALAVTALLSAGTPAAADVVFDFESSTATYVTPPQGGTRPGALSSLTLTNSGLSLTLTRQNGDKFDIVSNTGNQSGKPASFGTNSLDPFFSPDTNGFIGNLSGPVNGVKLDFGDYGQDSDTLTLRAFSGANGTGTLLGTVTVNYGFAAFPTFSTASVAAVGIQSFTINGTSDAAGFQNSVFYDNFSFITPAAVPEPSTLSLCAVMGLAAVLASRHRRRRSGRTSS